MDIETIVAQFIANEIAYDRVAGPIALEEPLLDGIMDSTDIMRLVFFLEEQFGITVADDELVPEHFSTVRKIADFVATTTA
jgi:acyl carrier protein